jgi:putative membrane protein
MKNRRFDTFIRNFSSIDKKICISKFPPEILFDLIDYVRNHWEGGYKGVLFVKKEIKLHHIVFTNSIDARNCVFEKQVEFYNCVFEEHTEFDKSSFLSDVSFKKSIFRGSDFKSISFREVTFGGDEIDFCLTEFYSGDFSKAIFKENSSIVDFKGANIVDFKGAKLYDVSFNEAQFERIVSFEKFENPTEIKNTKFERAIFSQQANFHNVLFYDDISFQNAIFRGKTYFLNITSKKISENTINKEKEFSFNGAKFQNETYFNGNNYIELNFSEVEFGVKDKDVTISFSNAKFYENIRFHHCDFYSSINFENTTFEKLVDFHGATFNEAQLFHFTDFSAQAIFANVKFKKEVQFLYCKIKPDSYIRFESSIFERGLEISRSNFKRNINFWDITITKEGEQEIFRNLNNQHYEDIKYIDDFGKYSTKEVSMVYRQIRETYCIIKDNFYAQNNRIEGLKFYEKEMSVYLEEKRFSKTKEKQKYKSNFYKNLKDNNIFYVLLAIIVVSMPLWVYSKSLFFYITLIISFVLVLVERWYKNKEKLKTKNPLKQNNYFSFIFLIIAIIFYLIWIYEAMNTIHYFVISYIFLFFSAVFLYFYQERDRIILWLNKNSNSFGTDWVVGINFTLLIALISSMIILSMTPHIVFSFDTEGIENFIRTLVEILNITGWADIKILNKEPNTWQYILIFFSRIFIGYGYYQTIQAFRKFGKS